MKKIYHKLGLVFCTVDQKRVICEKIGIPYYPNRSGFSNSRLEKTPVIAFDINNGETIFFECINSCVSHFHSNENNIRRCIDDEVDFPYENRLWNIVKL